MNEDRMNEDRMNVVFLGGGRITSAMLAGLRLAKTKHRLIVHERNPGKLRDLKKRYAAVVEPDLKRAVARADLLLIAVRPGSVKELLREIGEVDHPLLAVSLAAGVPIQILKNLLGPPVRWVRAMPSPVCRSGLGLTAVAFPQTPPKEDGRKKDRQKKDHRKNDRRRVRSLFGSFGPVVEIPKKTFDAFTVTFSPSHGYHALAALADAAQRVGLDRKTALLAGAHALADGIVAWRQGNQSLESLLEESATPGGIAAATATGMDAAGYRRAVGKGVAAGLRRARANARR